MHQGGIGRRRRRVCGAIAFGLAALVAGCAGAPKLYARWLAPTYTVPEYNYAAGRKNFYTVVAGDPFGMGEDAFDAAVIAVLNRFEPRPQPTTFTADPEAAARPLYRTVLVFDAPEAMTPTATCAAAYEGVATPRRERAEGEPVRVAAAYCRGGGALSSVIGEVGGVESVDDPGFAGLISQLVLVLFPLEDEDDDDCRVVLGGGC